MFKTETDTIEINCNVNLTQLYKLMYLLSENKLPFELTAFNNGLQLDYPNRENRKIIVSINEDTYGNDEGALNVLNINSPVFSLSSTSDIALVVPTAEQVLKLIQHYA